MARIAKYPTEMLGPIARIMDMAEESQDMARPAREAMMALLMDLLGQLKLERRGSHGKHSPLPIQLETN